MSHLLEAVVGFLLFYRRTPAPELIDQFRHEARELQPVPARSEDADPLWLEKRHELRDLLINGNSGAFLRWDPVRTTMVKRGRRPVAEELAHLRRRVDWFDRWRPALRESTVGRPRPFFRLPSSSAALIHQAYHVCRFEEVTAERLQDADLILEFGGGYGSMCRLLHQLGFRGEYWIYDLPEVSVLQRFFLRTVGIPVASTDTATSAAGVRTFSEPERLRASLLERPTGRAAFVAAWSLGETPLSLREKFLPEVRTFDAFLLGYTARFGQIDNVAFFRRWRSGIPHVAWNDVAIPHLRKAEWYLFGSRRRTP